MPNVLWNIGHQFPFLELQENIRRNKRNVDLGFWGFAGEEILTMLPLSLPIWLGGLWFFFFSKPGKAFRVLGWAWIITAGAIFTFNPRVYYLFPAFPVLFAGGGVLLESWLEGLPVVRP